MTIEFLCGCKASSDIDLQQLLEDVNQQVIVRGNVTLDAEGFVVCAKHPMYRRRGWRSLPTTPSGTFFNFAYAGFSALERERHFVFGEPLPERTTQVG